MTAIPGIVPAFVRVAARLIRTASADAPRTPEPPA